MAGVRVRVDRDPRYDLLLRNLVLCLADHPHDLLRMVHEERHLGVGDVVVGVVAVGCEQ